MEKPVSEHMTAGVVTCNPETTLTEVARLLSDADVSAVVVVDHQGNLQGIISQFDLLEYFGRSLEATLSRDVMTPEVLSILPDAPLQHAAQKMLDRRVHRLVVTDKSGARALGVISATDVIRAMRLNV